MELIDTHCHLDLEKHFQQFASALASAKAAGVGKIILPGVTQAGWGRLMELCSLEQGVFGAPGLHPLYLTHHRPHHLEVLEELINRCGTDGPVAIGEIGLDYYVKSVNRAAQQQLFEQQLKIAATAGLPVLLHVRKAHDQVLATLRRKHFPYGGIVHAFNGSYQQACHYIKLGFGIGICGTITYDRARRIRKVALQLPNESLVLETDAPDIPPANHKGQSNHPKYLPEILDALAALRGEPSEATAKYTSTNAKRILGLPH
ncbi:MAG: TatD family hydrolase [Desulfobulbaceae bacterium]|nr:TatD family hydrolase [Desulfobulbaceae bacterium]